MNPPSTNLEDQISRIRQVSRQVVRELGFLEDRVFDLGITHSQCHALVELDRQGLLTLQELSLLLKLDKSTMSRAITSLMKRGLIKTSASEDRRRKPLFLTSSGRKLVEKIHENSDRQVARALGVLSDTDREVAIKGMAVYSHALSHTREDINFEIRPIRKADDPDVARIIRKVMPEFGAKGPGFAINDPEVSHMFESYKNSKSIYFVLLHQGRIVGGGGIAPLEGGEPGTCELRKMYFLTEARGHGYGQKMLDTCLAAARKKGFKRCYLETLKHMHQAKGLYRKNGFIHLPKPMGSTGHFGCDAWYMKAL